MRPLQTRRFDRASPALSTGRTVRTVLTVLGAATAIALAACAGPSARGAEIRVRWVLPEAFPARVTLHRLPGDRRDAPPFLMRAYGPDDAIPLGEEVAEGNLPVTLDEAQRVLVAVRNPLDRPVRFWVAPHLPTPHSAEHALMIACLCVGETYEVPARGTWTRVLEFGIRRRDAVDVLVVTHVITLGEAPAIEPR